MRISTIALSQALHISQSDLGEVYISFVQHEPSQDEAGVILSTFVNGGNAVGVTANLFGDINIYGSPKAVGQFMQ